MIPRHQEWNDNTYWMSEVSPVNQHHLAGVVWLATDVAQYGTWFRTGPLPSFIFKEE